VKKLIRTILKEYISNERLIDDYISKFVRDVTENVPNVKTDVNYGQKKSGNESSTVHVFNYDEKYSPIIAKIIKKWKEKLFNYGIVVGSQETHSTRMDYRDKKMFFVSFKNITTRRIKPNKFVFHSSSIDPSVIFSEGLIPKSSNKGHWSHYNLAYPAAVFAGNTYDEVWGAGNIYVIDTTKASNTWWYDLNFFREHNLNDKKAIMTFEPVSPDAIVGVMTYREFKDLVLASSKDKQSKNDIESKIEDFFNQS